LETCTQVIAILASRPTFYPVRGKSCFRRSVRLSTGARRRPELRRCLDPAPLSDMPLGSPVIPLELCPAGLCVRKRAVALLSSASSNPELKGEHHTETIRIAIQFGPSEHVNIAFLYITAFNRYVQSIKEEVERPPKNRLVLFPAGRSTVYDDPEYTAHAFCLK
jgi:hypothetical protein